MAQATAIEWTDVSWNPVHGCSKVSPGCAHCYAETLSLRYWQTTKPWTPENAAENVILKPHKLREPLSKAKPWSKPCRVFVNSMSDLFHELVPDEYIAEVWGVMACARQHTFQVLTKRPERARALLTDESWVYDAIVRAGEWVERLGDDRPENYLWQPQGAEYDDFPALPNIWLGTSIENRRYVDRADHLRRTPAAVRFISAEPLLGPLLHDDRSAAGHYATAGLSADEIVGDTTIWEGCWSDGYDGEQLDLDRIDWLIVGGESGAGHRPIRAEWVRALRDACLDSRCPECFGERRTVDCSYCHCDGGTGTAFFFKQWGGSTSKAGGRTLDDQVYDEMPDQSSEQSANAPASAATNQTSERQHEDS